MKVYYAHAISDYSAYFEDFVLANIQTILPEITSIENPNQPHHQEGYKERGMAHFIDLCATLDGCIFTSFPGGIIGAGVAMEAQSFLDAGKPVWQIFVDEDYSEIRAVQIKELDYSIVATRDTTRELSKLYKALGRAFR